LNELTNKQINHAKYIHIFPKKMVKNICQNFFFYKEKRSLKSIFADSKKLWKQ